MLGTRGVGVVPADVTCTRVLDLRVHAAEVSSESYIVHHVRAEYRLSHCRRSSRHLHLHCRHRRQTLEFCSKAYGALAIIMYDDIDLP